MMENGLLEGAQARGLEIVSLPDTLDGAQSDADCLGDHAAGPTSDLARHLTQGSNERIA